MSRGLDDVRDRVLTENTAQAVFKHLDHLEDNRQRFEARWVWELLQNARDAARPCGVDVEVVVEGEQLRFKHNGRPFALEDIAHLIYHGSTKVASDDSIGHFGSGFLSTHLLSRVVSVSGQLKGGKHFSFSLDRSGADAESLRRSMDQSWNTFNESLKEEVDQQVATEFVYRLNEDGQRCGRAGLVDLRRCAAFVLAFCPEVRRITIKADSQLTVERLPSNEGEGIVRVACRGSDREWTSAILVEGDDRVQSAVSLTELSDGRLAEVSEEMPRVFIVFPLIGTSALGLPAVVNSRFFKPREDRNGLVLDGDTDGAKRNRELLESATLQMITMLKVAAKERWGGLPNLLSFGSGDLPEWANAEWLSMVVAPIVQYARDIPVLKTTGGRWIAPKGAWIPMADAAAAANALWHLTTALRESNDRLPHADEHVAWSQNLPNWARVLRTRPGELSEAWTIDRLARTVSSAGSLSGLAELLREGESVSAWLTTLLRHMHEGGCTHLLDELRILPSQTGQFHHRADLRVDEEIANELKDIGAQVEMDVRDSLLHEDIVLPEGVRLGVRTEAEVVGQVVDRFRQCCRNQKLEASLIAAAVSLMWWLSEQDPYRDRLDGLPVAMGDPVNEHYMTVELRQAATLDRAPLAPTALWPDHAHQFSSLFPRQMMLADLYAKARPDGASWRPLAARGLVRVSPLYETHRCMEAFLPDLPLPDLPGGAKHRAIHPTRVSAVAGLDEGEGEIFERARKSRSSALRLVRFLHEFLLRDDARAFETLSVACECGKEHRVYRGAWLVPLRVRAWIPPSQDEHGAERPTAQSLARLLSDEPELAKSISSEQARPLLCALGISSADFALRSIAADESTRVSLICAMGAIADAAGGDWKRVESLADEIRENPDVLNAIESHRAQRHRVLRNQAIGNLVEELLRRALEEAGFVVKRKPIGSDFEVSNDFVDRDQELWLEVDGAGHSTLLEVKATSGDTAKMTPKQVETACEQAHRFALCVVSIAQDNPTADQVRDNCRFVFSIGDQLRPLWSDYKSIKEATNVARQKRGSVELEVIDGQARFRIERALWAAGADFANAIARISCRGIGRAESG